MCSYPLAIVFVFGLLSSIASAATDFSVTNTSDSGPGSLRQAIIDSATTAGDSNIFFAPSLDGSTIHLASEIEITNSDPIAIHTTPLTPNGITIDGGSNERIFRLTGADNVGIQNLNFTGGNGNAAGLIFSSLGGAILVDDFSNLNILRCTFFENSANQGAAISCIRNSTLVLKQCTLIGESNPDPSGNLLHLSASGAVEVTKCTLTAKTGHDHTLIWANRAVFSLRNSIIDGVITLADDGDLTQIGTNLVQTINSEPGSTMSGTTALSGDPLLGALQDNGGRILTKVPGHASPAIDAATNTASFIMDQRGAAFITDGDHDGVAKSDIGSVEAIIYIVENTAPSGTSSPAVAGSLRAAVDAANGNTFSSEIHFNPNLMAGESIFVPLGYLTINNSDAPIFIDGSNLVPSVTLRGSAGDRGLLTVGSTSRLTLRGLSFEDSEDSAISNSGGDLTIENSTFLNNSSTSHGGALTSYGGTVVLRNCTLVGNSAQDKGGAIFTSGNKQLSLIHCTLTDNRAVDQGGGVYVSSAAKLNLLNTVVANNHSGPDTSLIRDDLRIDGFLLGQGSNIAAGLRLEAGAHNNLTSPLLTMNPLLKPLGFYGGGTKTRPPSSQSPLIDLASILTPELATDQRGFPRAQDGDRNGTILPDVGAVERDQAATGLIAYYDFEETGDAGLANKVPGATAFDATRGQAGDWVNTAAAPNGPGFDGRAAYTNTVTGLSDRSMLIARNALNLDSYYSQFIRIPLGTAPAELGNSFTITAWHALTPASLNTNARFYVFEAESNFDISWGTPNQPTTGGPLSELRYDAWIGGSTALGITGHVLKTGTWHHVAHVFSDGGFTTTLSLYIDGVFSGAHTAPTADIDFSTLKLGNARGSNFRFWDGMIDEVGLWNRALAPEEVAAAYQIGRSGLALDSPPSPSRFNLWLATFFPGETDPAIIDPNADPDHDKIANALEWVLGGDPNDPSNTGHLPIASIDDLGSDPIASGQYFVFTYHQTQSTDAVLSLEYNTALAGQWTTATIGTDGVEELITRDIQPGIDQVKIYIPRTLFGSPGINGPVGFARLRAQIPTE